MTAPAEVRLLLEHLAASPVLLPGDALPVNDQTLHALLAELARGRRSEYASLIEEVATAAGISVADLVSRARFLLACLVVPASGTHYEVLGVPPTATTREIRKRWAALIQRYHPDRLGGGDWLEGQARRLIEAYQTLKDPERRRAYDAQLAQSRPSLPRRPGPARPRLDLGPLRWRWVPVGIATVGVVIVVWAATRPAPPPLPRADLPTAPKLLETWEPVPGVPERSERTPRPAPPVTAPAPPAAESDLSPAPQEIPLLSLLREYRSRGSEPREAPITPPAEGPAPAATTPPPVEQPAPPTPESTASPGPPAANAPASEFRRAVAGREAQGGAAPRAGPTPVGPARLTPRLRGDGGASGDARASLARQGEEAERAGHPAGGPMAEPPAADSPAPVPPPSTVTPSAKPSAETPSPPSPPAPPVVTAAPKPAPPPATPPAAVVTPPSSPTSEPAPVAGQVASPSTPEGPSNTEIFALIDRFRQAYERKDLGAVMEFFGSEPRDREVRGRAAVERLYAANFSNLRDIAYELTQLRVQEPQSDGHVVVEGRFRIRAARTGWFSPPVDVSGPIRWVLRREEGHLRIVGIDYEPTSR